VQGNFSAGSDTVHPGYRGTLDVLIHNTSSRAWGMDKLLPMVRSTAQVSSWHHVGTIALRHLSVAAA
jgi:hypothetical protein